jgi:hypothetical protein
MSHCCHINGCPKLKGLNENVLNPLKWYCKMYEYLLDPAKHAVSLYKNKIGLIFKKSGSTFF